MKYAPIVLVLGFLQSGSALASPSEQETTTPKSPAHALPDTEWFASPGPAPVMRRIEGNRAELGPFREYYRTPAGASLAAHRHTADMHIKVLEGRQFILMGDLESARVKTFDAGSTFVIPAGVWHVEWFESDTLVEISGIGPMRTERPPTTPRVP